MLHAADYGNMDVSTLKDEMTKRKNFDKKIETKMQ